MSEEGRRYDLVEVTADVAVRARGSTLEELFTNAAWGMADLICDTATVEAGEERFVEASAHDPGSLLVAFLTELLVLHETEGVVFSAFDVRVVEEPDGWRVKAFARGELYDHARHDLLHDIKAVTYHTLAVSPEEGYAQVLFDV
jgi:SHS2 domain-containing protein